MLATVPVAPDEECLPPEIYSRAIRFEQVGLDAAIRVGLLDRIDTKIPADIASVSRVLDQIVDDFVVVEVAGSIAPAYRSVYFDTDEMDLYDAHHNGRRIRHKIRYRTYLSTDTTFFELKVRENPDRTTKYRTPVPWIPTELGAAEHQLLADHNVSVTGARPALDVRYNRITLVGESERVTIDFSLTCTSATAQVSFSESAIIELKQARRNYASPAFQAIRNEGLRPGSMSKYCIGVASTVPGVKTNKFKPRLRFLGGLESRNILR